jgi:hypothetical protein
MAEDLPSSVRDAISEFVKSRTSTNIPLDVLRIIRDESALLYETQQIYDTFDNDPFEICENDDSEINRAKVCPYCIPMQLSHVFFIDDTCHIYHKLELNV